MLLVGIQEKADSVITNLDDYVVGTVFNPVTGAWEVNGLALLSQEKFNMQLEADMDKARAAMNASVAGSIADCGLILGTVLSGQKTLPEGSTEAIDFITSLLEAGLVAYSEALYGSILNTLENNHRDLMIQAVNDMYNNVDAYLFADYEALLEELREKEPTGLSEEEKLLKTELERLLDAVKTTEKAWMEEATAEVDRAAQQAAEDLVTEIGLTEHKVLSNTDIALEVVEAVCQQLVCEIMDIMADKLLEEFKLDDKALATHMKEIALNSFEIVLEDLNDDEAFDAGELLTSILESLIPFTDIGRLEDIAVKGFEEYSTKKIIQDMNTAGIPNMNGVDDLEAASERIRTCLQGQEESLKEAQKTLERRRADLKSRGVKNPKMTTENQKIEDLQKKIKTSKDIELTIDTQPMILVLVEDAINVTADFLEFANASAGLGDMMDNEVFYAYVANYMVQAKEAAEVRRASLDSGIYADFDNSKTIDDATIAELKNFVNRVYAVYEQDKIGHASYATLAAGWHYVESGKKLEDWTADKKETQKNILKNSCKWLLLSPISSVFVSELLMLYDVVTLFGATNQSEYLKKLDSTHEKAARAGTWTDRNGNQFTFSSNFDSTILSVERCEAIYTEIGNKSIKVELPAKYKNIN